MYWSSQRWFVLSTDFPKAVLTLKMALRDLETLLCLSSRNQYRVRRAERPVDSSGEISLYTATNLFGGASLYLPFSDTGLGFSVVGHPVQRHHVQRLVEPTVATSIESVAHRVARRRWNGIDPCQRGERGF